MSRSAQWLSLAEELASFLESGVACVVGTADAFCSPEITRGWGPQLTPALASLSLCVERGRCGDTLSNLAQTGLIAVSVTSLVHCRVIHLKGLCVEMAPPSASELSRARRHFDAVSGSRVELGVMRPPAANVWSDGLIRLTMQVERACDDTSRTPGQLGLQGVDSLSPQLRCAALGSSRKPHTGDVMDRRLQALGRTSLALARCSSLHALALQALASLDAELGSHRAQGEPLLVRYYEEDDSVFFGREYVIKGAAGRILWRLLQQLQTEQRDEFTNRELRLDKTLKLSPFKDNLEARLIALRRRLLERGGTLALVPMSRGRFRLETMRPLRLEHVAPPAQ
jgi:hypothetical protein